MADWPLESRVLYNTTYNAGTMHGTVRTNPLPSSETFTDQPDEDRVLAGTVYAGGTKTGTFELGTLDYPAAANVRKDVAYANGDYTGTLVVPAVGNVRKSVVFDATSVGTLVVPAVADVRAGTTFDTASVGTMEQVTVGAEPDGDNYCTRADVEDIFGAEQVKKWGNMSGLDPLSTAGVAEIDARVDNAIASARIQIHSDLRGGPYILPITGTEALYELRCINATLAGVALYEAKGVIDYNPQTGKAEHRYQWKRDWAERRLALIKSGKLYLDAPRVGKGACAPRVPG